LRDPVGHLVFQARIDDSGTKGTGTILMSGGLFSRACARVDITTIVSR
jgi:hypothetical protein